LSPPVVALPSATPHRGGFQTRHGWLRGWGHLPDRGQAADARWKRSPAQPPRAHVATPGRAVATWGDGGRHHLPDRGQPARNGDGQPATGNLQGKRLGGRDTVPLMLPPLAE